MVRCHVTARPRSWRPPCRRPFQWPVPRRLPSTASSCGCRRRIWNRRPASDRRYANSGLSWWVLWGVGRTRSRSCFVDQRSCSKSYCNQCMCFLGLKFEVAKLVQGECSTLGNHQPVYIYIFGTVPKIFRSWNSHWDVAASSGRVGCWWISMGFEVMVMV